jgi:hypothetical protein
MKTKKCHNCPHQELNPSHPAHNLASKKLSYCSFFNALYSKNTERSLKSTSKKLHDLKIEPLLVHNCNTEAILLLAVPPTIRP